MFIPWWESELEVMKWTFMESLSVYICFDLIIVYTDIVIFNMTFLLLVGE
jgi:hypothetical protein